MQSCSKGVTELMCHQVAHRRPIAGVLKFFSPIFLNECSLFSLEPSQSEGRVYKSKICLSVCHHFEISNIGPDPDPDPDPDPRITPDPTYHILLGRG